VKIGSSIWCYETAMMEIVMMQDAFSECVTGPIRKGGRVHNLVDALMPNISLHSYFRCHNQCRSYFNRYSFFRLIPKSTCNWSR
jgi:hypothetical protein